MPSNSSSTQFEKHSSGDLHSRLKTRKVLGVGEIDADGDVHRSKISQILGHSDHLYKKLPHGLWVWQIVQGLTFTLHGILALLMPTKLVDFFLTHESGPESILIMRFYSAALLSLAVMWWYVLDSNDRPSINLCLLVTISFYAIQLIASTVTLLSFVFWTKKMFLSMLLRGLFITINILYCKALNQSGAHRY